MHSIVVVFGNTVYISVRYIEFSKNKSFIFIAIHNTALNKIVDSISAKIIIIHNFTNSLLKIIKNIRIRFIYKYKNTINFVSFFKKVFAVFIIATAILLIFSTSNLINQLINKPALTTIYNAHYIATPKYTYIAYNNTTISFSENFLLNLLIITIRTEFEFTNIIIDTVCRYNF